MYICIITLICSNIFKQAMKVFSIKLTVYLVYKRTLNTTAQLPSTSVLALKYEYELNCQEESKFSKFISKRRIIFLRHSSILRRIWLNFMALCLDFIRRLFQFSLFFPRISNFFDLSITEET
jgi:hypothetical protein